MEHNHSCESGGCSCEENLLEHIDHEEEQTIKPVLIFIIGLGLVGGGYLIELFKLSPPIVSQIIFLIAVIYVGKDIVIHGLKELKHGHIKIELLVTIATVGAFLLNSGEEGALLMVLFYLGEYLEDYSLNKSKKSLVKLSKMTPDVAVVKHGDHEHEKAVKDLNIGDVVIVKPGDKIPIDGIIVKGQSSVNQASITGESLPVAKTVNDEVYGSTINEDGYIEVEVNKKPEDTIFAKIIQLIKNSEKNKAKIDLFIDRFAEVYTPTVVGLALLVAIVPTLLGYSIYDWGYRALTLLVISCPCALVISTPVSFVSAITKGTKNGIIIKGGEYIEEISKVREILFDKTGTLTEGNLKIDNVESYSNYTNEELLKIACSIESLSNHPIAGTFSEYLKDNEIELLDVDDFTSIAGKGLKGSINNVTYYVGKKTLFNDEVENGEGTDVFVGMENKVLGLITLSDKIRDDSEDTIANLKKLNIKTAMITGDNENTAKKVASNLNLDDYHADLLPEEKVEIVQESVKKCDDVAMVGDGVNDTPSLAMANVGIAMGLEGADVAIETADIVLLEDSLSKITLLVELGRKTMSKIKFNVAFTLLVKASLMILGIAGVISLWEAILVGDMGITLLVVGNSLLLAK